MAPKSTVPETGHEWKVALTEVKKMYLDRKYQSCAGRCHELLRGAKQCVSRVASYQEN